MKKLILLVSILAIISCKQEEKPTYTVLSGKLENNAADNAIIRGNGFESKLPIDGAGGFSDTVYIKNDGFYEMYIGRERTGIYLEKGKNLSVTLNTDGFDETIKYTGDLANVNNLLASKFLWEEQNTNYKKLYSLEEESFLEELNKNQESLDSLYATHNITNKNFKKALANEDKYSKAIVIENYSNAHSYYTKKENFKVSDDFYEPLESIDFADTLAFRNSVAYQNLLNAHFNRLVSEETSKNNDQNETLVYLNKVDDVLPDGYAKDKIMSSYLQFGLKADSSLKEAYTIYKNSNPDAESLAKITERYNTLKNLTKGKPSPTFDYENHKGGTTSLADLKGKYVYIDVWATWCGPCLREIPSLKKVEADYSDKNVQFVSISIDEPKDYDKWKSMVTEKELVGIQLMADQNWKSKFVKDYAILGIPRFILVDPEGNIVSSDAPRPSNPELRKTLDELL
ncbi:TlpA family protein disulfide reductase [Aequorivita marina]|uniref:TlpA family protein disulfide reductase n=1 Tax=Aequorivita marina TaxID=3073654 RepID=UPI0028746F26|nr:TlpA disulfide reductase family protein [Aequorivita sp. S2608]MDS1297754.1 TlpA disulfide reductase family protein [Aequorivita sp. S2608]